MSEPSTVTSEPKRRPSTRPRAIPIAVPVLEACRIGGFGKTKAWELIGAGALRTVRVGRRRLVLYASLAELLEPQT